jgi:hypothetical protein
MERQHGRCQIDPIRMSTSQKLAAMHEKFVQRLLDKLNGEGEVTAAEMNVIRQFLKDNRVEDLVERPGSKLGDLLKAVEDELPFTDDIHA